MAFKLTHQRVHVGITPSICGKIGAHGKTVERIYQASTLSGILSAQTVPKLYSGNAGDQIIYFGQRLRKFSWIRKKKS